MVNLPRRKSQLDVEIPDTDAVLHVKPMSDPQTLRVFQIVEERKSDLGLDETAMARPKGGAWYEIVKNGRIVEKVQGEDEAREAVRRHNDHVDVGLAELKKLEVLDPLIPVAEKNLLGASGVEIGEEPFDADRDDHVASLPWTWRALTVVELMQYAQMDEESGKGSRGPGAPSTRA